MDDTVNYAQSVVSYAISGALTHVQSIGVERVETVGIAPVDTDTHKGISGLLDFPLPVLIGLSISAVCVILGFILLCLYMKKDKVRHQKLHKMAQRTMMESLSGSFRYFTPDGRHMTDVDDASYCTSEISSVQIDFEKGAVSKMPTEKINVEFDPDYASSCGLISETSSYDQDDKHSAPGLNAIMSHPPHYLDTFGRYRD